MKLFPATVPLEIAAMELLGLLKKTARGNTFNLVLTN